MGITAVLRKLYIGTTNTTHDHQGQPEKQLALYKLWSPLYDLSLKLDPGYAVVQDEDTVLDIGCDTGLATTLTMLD